MFHKTSTTVMAAMSADAAAPSASLKRAREAAAPARVHMRLTKKGMVGISPLGIAGLRVALLRKEMPWVAAPDTILASDRPAAKIIYYFDQVITCSRKTTY